MWIKIDNHKLSNLIKVGSLTFENPEIISDIETPCFVCSHLTTLKQITIKASSNEDGHMRFFHHKCWNSHGEENNYGNKYPALKLDFETLSVFRKV